MQRADLVEPAAVGHAVVLIVEIVAVILRHELNEAAGGHLFVRIVQRKAHLVTAVVGGGDQRAAVLATPCAAEDIEVRHLFSVLDQTLEGIRQAIKIIVAAVVAIVLVALAAGG